MTRRIEVAAPGLLVTFWSEGYWRVAFAIGDSLVPVETAEHGDMSGMRRLLLNGEEAIGRAWDRAQERVAHRTEVLDRSTVLIGPTIPDPEKILCVGFNYNEHTTEMRVERPVAPNVFAKFRNSLVGDRACVPLGTASSQIDYEGELAVVIGRRCKSVRPDEVAGCIAGYTIVNDVTARDLQFRTSQWTLGKSADGCCPMGPGLMPRDNVPDVQALRIVTRLNGDVVQDGSTSDMVFSVAEIVSEVTRVMTLVPGDVIATGTPAGVGYKAIPPRFLGDGDEVAITINGIGTLTNRFVGGPSDPFTSTFITHSSTKEAPQ